MRSFRLLVVAFPIVALIGVGAWFALNAPTRRGPGGSPNGRLVVLVSFDQMRGDYHERFAGAYGKDGFERIKKDGVWYANAHLPYACTSTGPGHASISTGAPPSVHGIIENAWYDRTQGKSVYCAASDRPYERVPMNADAGQRAKGLTDNGMSPERLLVTTVGDELRKQTNGKGRVFSLALKDRAAILMGGKEPTACYCFDTATGQFHTSTYYREKPHPWVEKFNASSTADRWFQTPWTYLRAAPLYDTLASADDAVGEGNGPNKMGRVFPHALNLGLQQANGIYYSALETSPFGNELVWEFAKSAIEAENLGRGEAADLLCLGFSSNDLIGHTWGPDSHEVMDVTLRSDKLIAEMIAHLTETLGEGKFAIVITADHGVCPLPEQEVKKRPTAERFDPAAEFPALGEALDETFGRRTIKPGQWVERIDYPWVYLNRTLATEQGVPMEQLEAFTAQWLGNRRVCQIAFPRAALTAPAPTDPLVRSAQLAYQPDRCGDVLIVNKPYTLPGGNPKAIPAPTGTSHGSPHPYDTHVTLFAFGVNIPPLGVKADAVSSLLVAPIVSHALGITPPTTASEKVPAEFTAKK